MLIVSDNERLSMMMLMLMGDWPLPCTNSPAAQGFWTTYMVWDSADLLRKVEGWLVHKKRFTRRGSRGEVHEKIHDGACQPADDG